MALVPRAVVAAGFIAWLHQWARGLSVTGMGRNVSWGLYIANFTFFVGVAASAVTVVLPYYLHSVKEFKRIVILGEFLAVSSVVMSLLFIIVDLGRPDRAFNMILHPTPNSLLFWDMIVLNGYLFLNLVIGWSTLDAEAKGEKPLPWVRFLIILSIPWAVEHPYGDGLYLPGACGPRRSGIRPCGRRASLLPPSPPVPRSSY